MYQATEFDRLILSMTGQHRITYYSFKHGLGIIIDHNDIGVSSRMGVIPPSLEVCVKSDFK